MVDAKKLAATLLGVVSEWVEPAVKSFGERLDEFGRRLAAIPAGPRGEKGDRGDPGAAGDVGGIGPAGPQGVTGNPGSDGESGAQGIPGERVDGASGLQGAAGVDGKPGRDGKDVDPSLLNDAIDIKVKAAVSNLPAPKDGRDGESVHPDTIARMVLEEVQRVVAALPRPKDGESGRDALAVDVLPGIEESKSYPRGTQAQYRGGEIRAIRNTDPITDGLDKAGWSVIRNGIAEESEEAINDGRTIRRTTVYTSGGELVREIKTSAVIYRGVWREGTFERGDVCTWSGSSWHCQEATTDKPDGTSRAWVLMVKRGNPGKDGAVGGSESPPSTPLVRVK